MNGIAGQKEEEEAEIVISEVQQRINDQCWLSASPNQQPLSQQSPVLYWGHDITSHQDETYIVVVWYEKCTVAGYIRTVNIHMKCIF